MFRSLLLLLFLIGLADTGAAENRVRLHAFGNSLVNHAAGDAQTNIPVWIARMARADGKLFSMSGQFGFLKDFAARLPPSSDWSFRGVRGAWNPARRSFGEAGFTHVLIAPANFIQYRAPKEAYEDGSGDDASPLSVTLTLIDWLQEASPGIRIVLYQGWADMAPFSRKFPPRARALRKYHAFNAGEYSDWYETWLAELRAARPDARITLAPVARVLAGLLSEAPLAGIPAEALYSDNAPHGTPTLYLLAAMVTYATLYDSPPPEALPLPETIHPLLREHYRATASRIWQEVAVSDTALLAPPPGPASASAPASGPPPAPTSTPERAPLSARPAVLEESLDTGLENPALAMGLNGLSDWSVQHPFVDIFKTARGWIGHREGEWGAWRQDDLIALGLLSADGWPIALPEGATHLEALILSDQPPETQAELAGRYRVTWKGTGTLRILGRARKVSIGDHEAWFSYTPGDGSIAIAILETDPRGTGDFIRDISVVREKQIPLFEAGAVFNPDWLAVVSDLRAIRFMDWMQTNNSPLSRWEDRPRPSDASWSTRGVPLEIMVQLANEIGADPWFNMPHMADDDYIRRFAEYVRDHLDRRLIAHVEYSNEMWNFLFGQTIWAEAQARALWGAAAGGEGWMQYAGKRASEVMRIWTDVFAAEAETRLRRIAAVHTGWPGLEAAFFEAPLWRESTPGTPAPGDTFDAYAVSGYFGLELGSDEMAETVRGWIGLPDDAGIAEAARALREGSLRQLLDELYPHHARAAARYGLDLVMYEGGTHVVGSGAQRDDPAFEAFFRRLNYSDEMALLYDELLTGWRAAGGTLFNAFVDVARPTKYGAWGAQRWLGDENPRWQVLAEYNAAGADWESRAPGTFTHGILRLGGEGADVLQGTPKPDTLIAGPGDDILVSNGGGDHLNGGEGFDTAILGASPEAYTFATRGGRLLATGPDGTTSLFGVEMLQFAGAPGEILETAALP